MSEYGPGKSFSYSNGLQGWMSVSDNVCHCVLLPKNIITKRKGKWRAIKLDIIAHLASVMLQHIALLHCTTWITTRHATTCYCSDKHMFAAISSAANINSSNLTYIHCLVPGFNLSAYALAFTNNEVFGNLYRATWQ